MTPISNPLADDEGPLGEYPDLPARSGVARYLDAADRIRDHATNLQAAVDEIREVASSWYTADGVPPLTPPEKRCGASILGILERNHV